MQSREEHRMMAIYDELYTYWLANGRVPTNGWLASQLSTGKAVILRYLNIMAARGLITSRPFNRARAYMPLVHPHVWGDPVPDGYCAFWLPGIGRAYLVEGT